MNVAKSWRAAVVAMAVAFLWADAFAVDTDMMYVGGPCAADTKALCPEVKPGKERVYNCLTDNAKRLSSACSDVMRSRERSKQIGAEFKNACKAELKQHCEKVEAGRGRLMKCLEPHESSLAGACAAEYARMKARTPPRAAPPDNGK